MRMLKRSGIMSAVSVVCLWAVLFLPGCVTSNSDADSSGYGAVSSKYRSRDRTYSRSSSYEEKKVQERKHRKTYRPVRKKQMAVAQTSVDVRNENDSFRNGVRVYRLKSGDPVIIYLRGIQQAEKIDDVIDENGDITLPYINRVKAAGRTTSELELVIRSSYLSQQIYKDITVNIVVPSQSYFVQGEVRSPGRYPLLSGVTIVQAIATAGGYSGFENPRKVKLLRGGKAKYLDAQAFEKHPEKDIAVEAGDTIVVPRSVF